jgi:uncharacterized protein YfiM (DUF2279 family)
MSVISLPADLLISSMKWEQQRFGINNSGQFGSQVLESGVPLWAVSIQFDKMNESSSGPWKTLLMQLRGSTNQLEVWDVARPVPLGTMRGTMTLSSSAVQGAVVLVIDAGVGQAGKTLLKGDWLGLGSGVTQQLVMVMEDATANGSGVITVAIEPPLRNAFSSGAAVTWDKPKALFRRQNQRAGWDYQSVFASGFALDLFEDWRT